MSVCLKQGDICGAHQRSCQHTIRSCSCEYACQLEQPGHVVIQQRTAPIRVTATRQRPDIHQQPALSGHARWFHSKKNKSNFSRSIAECTSKAIFQWYISCRCLPGSKYSAGFSSQMGEYILFIEALFLGRRNHRLDFHRRMCLWLQSTERGCPQRVLDSETATHDGPHVALRRHIMVTTKRMEWCCKSQT